MDSNKNSNAIGQQAEAFAKAYLLKQGLGFIQANFHCKLGEIDLIMSDQDSLVFIEVKARKNHHFGSGLDAVNNRKQQKLIKASQFYLQQRRLLEHPCRFDVISINSDSGQMSIEQWLKNAFCS